MTDDNELLQPSLSRGVTQLYSSRAGFFVAFFGGALASAVFTLINSRRLNRFNRDVFIIGAFTLAALLGGILLFTIPREGMSYEEILKTLLARRQNDPVSFKFGPRIMALCVWIVGYLLHMKEYAAMKMSEVPPLNAWKIGLIVAVVGRFVEVLIIFGFIYLRAAN
jgi:hypothetical protein